MDIMVKLVAYIIGKVTAPDDVACPHDDHTVCTDCELEARW
jgi:hypothetical protein